MGSIYRRGNILWIKFYRDGVPVRESTGTDDEGAAAKLLQEREVDVSRGLVITAKTNKARLEEIADDVITDYEINGKRSLRDLKRSFELHLFPFFGRRRRAIEITTAAINKYIAKRQEEKATNASINRELSHLGRAFSLAIRAGKLTQRPAIDLLREENTRTGFFERPQFEAVRAQLPEPLKPLVTFYHETGWRLSEALGLQWRQVDLNAGTVSLDGTQTKNRRPRVIKMTSELRMVLEAQRQHTDAVQRKRGVIIAHVFHRNGRPIVSFRKAWAKACQEAGCPGRLVHDFRRSAVRNLNAAGVTQAVAMKVTGHLTDSVYRRYAIVSEGDLTEAAARLDRLAGTISGTISPDSSKSADSTA